MRKQLASLGSVISLMLLAGLAKAGVSQSPAETASSARSIGISGECGITKIRDRISYQMGWGVMPGG